MITKQLAVIAACLSIPTSSHAATKYLECREGAKNTEIVSFIVVDDNSDKAEVKRHAVTFDCNASGGCPADLYKKEVLPTVLRLTHITAAPKVTYETIIEIDRSTLSLASRTTLNIEGQPPTTNVGSGKCVVTKIDETKKVL